MKLPWPTRELQHIERALLLVSLTLVTSGALLDSVWLIGAGAWALIAGVLIDLSIQR